MSKFNSNIEKLFLNTKKHEWTIANANVTAVEVPYGTKNPKIKYKERQESLDILDKSIFSMLDQNGEPLMVIKDDLSLHTSEKMKQNEIAMKFWEVVGEQVSGKNKDHIDTKLALIKVVALLRETIKAVEDNKDINQIKENINQALREGENAFY
jgi:hypothetical protein